MSAPGLLFERSLLLLDLVLIATAVAVPLLYAAWRRARTGRYPGHRNWMLGITAILGVAVVIVELALKESGGVLVLAEGGTYEDTTLLVVSLVVHVVFAAATTFWWLGLIAISLWKFRPPKPGSFSRFHKVGGYGALTLMTLTCLSAAELYLVAFIL